MRSLLLAAAVCLSGTFVALASPSAAQHRDTTWANPVDLDYRYGFDQTHEGIAYRTGADPSVVLHQDRYYMFLTQADGYWTSQNLVDWTFVTPSRWPLEGSVGPAAVSDGDRLYLMQSAADPTPMLSSDKPETGRFGFHSRLMPAIPGAVRGRDPMPGPNDRLPAGPWAPDVFIDTDGKWYVYWGSSDVFPLYGSEISPTPPMEWVDTPTAMFGLNPARHGWERFGLNHSGALPNGTPVRPFIDGARMNRIGDRYYLQYSAPGTEYNAYATGTYVGRSPLGPFTYAPYSPVSYKPGGFVQGAGHGSTFQDRYGNWWNMSTSWVGLNWSFERRVSLMPGGVHADGQLWFSSRFGDFPQKAVDGPITDPDSLFTGWMPLSYRARATATSTLDAFSADRATDEDPRTFWVAGTNTPGQLLTLDLGAVKTVNAVQVNFADYKSGVYGDEANQRARFRIQWSVDGQSWFVFASRMTAERDSPNAYLTPERPVRARYVRYNHGEVPGDHLAISDLRVFGNAEGEAPAAPQGFSLARQSDQRDALLRFQPVPGVLGYNIRWGVAPDRLHSTYQVWADELAAGGGAVLIRALNLGVDYHFAVEAFGETGVSPLTAVLAAPAGRTATVRAPDPAPPEAVAITAPAITAPSATAAAPVSEPK